MIRRIIEIVWLVGICLIFLLAPCLGKEADKWVYEESNDSNYTVGYNPSTKEAKFTISGTDEDEDWGLTFTWDFLYQIHGIPLRFVSTHNHDNNVVDGKYMVTMQDDGYPCIQIDIFCDHVVDPAVDYRDAFLHQTSTFRINLINEQPYKVTGGKGNLVDLVRNKDVWDLNRTLAYRNGYEDINIVVSIGSVTRRTTVKMDTIKRLHMDAGAVEVHQFH